MKIDASDLYIENLLNIPTEVYQIPVYQRAYSWGKDQWEDLWQDIVKIDDEDTHFLGSIVVISGSHTKGFNEYEVVDGQQRLTTILLLLIATRDISDSESDQKFIEDSYLFSKTRTEKKPKLIPGRKDRDVFSKLLKKSTLNTSDKETNIYKAYEYFSDKLASDISDIVSFSEKVLKNVSLVQISAESHYDAFKLFETLNNRGLELSATDLIKNYILGKVPLDNKDELEQCIELWDSIINNLENIDKVRFFRHYLMSEKNGVISKNQLYLKYQQVIDSKKNEDNLTALLEDMAIKSEIYKNIVLSTFSDNDINDALMALSHIEASTSYSLVLKTFTTDLNKKEKLTLLQILETFSLRRSICKISTRDLDDVYNHLCTTAFTQDKPIDYISNYLKDRMPTDEEFSKNFANNVRTNKEVQTKHILKRIENHITNNTNEKTINNNMVVHLEHIMPKQIKNSRSKKEFGNWEDYLGEDAKKHKDFINRIGNLTLLGSTLNISISNNPFESKKEQYELSNIKLTKDLCDYPEWRTQQIADRSSKLAAYACEIWTL